MGYLKWNTDERLQKFHDSDDDFDGFGLKQNVTFVVNKWFFTKNSEN